LKTDLWKRRKKEFERKGNRKERESGRESFIKTRFDADLFLERPISQRKEMKKY